MPHLPEGPFFDFPFTRRTATPKIPTQVSPDEIANLSEIARQIKSALSTFGKSTSAVYSLGDRFRLFVGAVQDEKQSLLSYSTDIPGILNRTANELTANSSREHPLTHATALTSQVFVGLLRAVATKNPEMHAVPTFNDASGTYPIPVLRPTAFVQPATPRDRSMSSTMRILGCMYSKQHGLRYLLTDERLEVSFTPELEASMSVLSISSIRDGLWFAGTIHQDDGNQWATVPGGQIIQQEAI